METLSGVTRRVCEGGGECLVPPSGRMFLHIARMHQYNPQAGRRKPFGYSARLSSVPQRVHLSKRRLGDEVLIKRCERFQGRAATCFTDPGLRKPSQDAARGLTLEVGGDFEVRLFAVATGSASSAAHPAPAQASPRYWPATCHVHAHGFNIFRLCLAQPFQ
jgi:hypothetical protein